MCGYECRRRRDDKMPISASRLLRQVADLQRGEGQHFGDLFHVADAAELVRNVRRFRAAAGAVQQAGHAGGPQVAGVVAGVGARQHCSNAVRLPPADDRADVDAGQAGQVFAGRVAEVSVSALLVAVSPWQARLD